MQKRLPTALLLMVVLVVGVGLSTVVHRVMADAQEQAADRAFQRLAERTADLVEDHLGRPRYGLGGARGAVAAAGTVLDVAGFARYVRSRDLAAEFPGVRGFGLIERVPRAGLDAWQAAVAAQYADGFRVLSQGEAEDLYVIRSIEPLAGNRQALGFDVGSEPHRRQAAETAWLEGRLAVTAPVTILQDPLQRPAALMMLPVFASGLPARRDADDPTVALVYAAFVYADELSDLLPAQEAPVAMRVLDLGPNTRAQVLYSSADSSAEGSRFSLQRELALGGRQLRIEVWSTPLFEQTYRPAWTWLWTLGGLLLTLLTALLVHNAGRLRARAQTLAEGMTRELDRLAMVARLTTNAVVVTDADGRIEWVNPAFEALTGYGADALKGQRPGDLLQSERTDRAFVEGFGHAIRAGQPFRGEAYNRSRTGRDYLIAVEAQPILDSAGKVQGFIAVQSDITEQREREQALRLRESLLDRMGEVAGVGGWRVELDSGTVEWTRETYRIHELPQDHVPSLDSGISFYAPDARPRIESAVREGIASGKGWDLELPLITAKGRHIIVRTVGTVEYAQGRPVRLIGAFQDITGRVAQEQALRSQRERLQNIIDGTGAGTWEWNVQTGATVFNERWAEIIGYRLDELGPTDIQTWMRFAHPDDLERSGERLQAHFEGRSERYECEARMRHRDGHWVWVLDRGRVRTWTVEGKPEWMFGTHLDISARKRIELELAETSRLLRITLESIGDAVVTADASGRITWLNPVAEAMSGWSRESAQGQVCTEVLRLRTAAGDEPVRCPIESCLREGKRIDIGGDIRLRSRGGQGEFVIELSVAPVRDDAGTSHGVVIIFHDVTERARLAAEMAHRATHDALTGLVNRAEFERQLQRALAEAGSSGRAGAVLFVDLDHFKIVNDASGHAAGDQLLRHVASLLQESVRARDVVARFGGDEFALLLESCPLDRAEAIGQRICSALDAFRFTAADGRRYRIGSSIGLVPLDARWASMSALLQSADAACYTAKAEGRGRVVLAQSTPSLADETAPLGWGPLIEDALVQDRFTLFAQRVVPLHPQPGADGLRCELLLRLQDERGNWVSPGLFMPAAERYQLAGRIDRWVLAHALQLLRASGTQSLVRIAINVSGQSIGDRLFHDFAIGQIQTSGLPPSVLCIEITETTAIVHPKEAAVFIRKLRDMGVQVALDDFGAGAASYGYLKHLEVDVLKIDGQFIKGLAQSELDRVAVRSFVEVARVLGLDVVAEQVEDVAALEPLRAIGVDYVQGFGIHRPEPFEALLSRHRAEHASPS